MDRSGARLGRVVLRPSDIGGCVEEAMVAGWQLNDLEEMVPRLWGQIDDCPDAIERPDGRVFGHYGTFASRAEWFEHQRKHWTTAAEAA